MLGEGIEQLYVFAVFAVVGVALGVVYLLGIGVFRSKVAGVIFDAVFGFLAIYLVWKVNLETNNGEFRLFIVVGLALGVILAYFTCKTALDKVSCLLYNLFTTKLVDKDDETHFSQKVNVNTIRSGSASRSDTGVHAVGNAYADVSNKGTHRQVRTTVSRSRRYHRRTSGNAGISSNGRIHKKVG